MTFLNANHLDGLLINKLMTSTFKFIGVIDSTGQIVYIPATQLSFPNSTADLELLNTNIVELFLVEDAKRLSELLASLDSSHQRRTIRLRLFSEVTVYTWVQLTMVPFEGFHTEDCYIFSIHPITSEEEELEELTRLAYTDPLTGLANRRKFETILANEIHKSRQSDDRIALLMIDIDNFKGINDSFGHLTGDHVLQVISERLKKTKRPTTTIARFGGDELVVLLKGFETIFHLIKEVETIVELIEEPMSLSEDTITPMVSVGIAISTVISSPEQMIEMADQAMYATKRQHEEKYTIYNELIHLSRSSNKR